MVHRRQVGLVATVGLLALTGCGGDDGPSFSPIATTASASSGSGAAGSGGEGTTGATGAGGNGATATTGVEECGPWPGGTPGLEVGETMPERSWFGLRPGATMDDEFQLAEFRKCGGGGVDVIVIDTSAYT